MPAISQEELSNIRSQLNILEQCAHDIETITEFDYAGQPVPVPAADVTAAKTDTNTLLATFKTDVAALTDIV